MTERIKKLAEEAMTKDFLFPSRKTTQFTDNNNLNNPICVAKCLREYLLNQDVLISDGERLGGGFRFDDSFPSDAYHKAGHKHARAFFELHSDYQPENNPVCFLDWDHYCANFPFILENGFNGYVKKIEIIKRKLTKDIEKQQFLTALDYTCETIKLYSEKVSEEYEENGFGEIAQNCRRVPYYPVKNFHEAVQSVWFSWLLLPDSLGRLDQVLYPFYKQDIEKGGIDRDTAYELICELFIKVFAQHGFWEHRSGDTTISVGGYTAKDEDGFNEVSKMLIEALTELPTWRPQISFRYTGKTAFETFKYITQMNIKQKNIVFTNDEVRIKALERIGIQHEDAVNYTMIGCNEWTIMGKGNTGSQGFFNPLHSLEVLLLFHPEEFERLSTFDEFYSCYASYLNEDVITMMELTDAYFDAASQDMNVLTSILVDGCIEKALPISCGGAQYNVSNWSCNGFANIIDSLSVIKQFVFDEKVFSLFELSDMLKSNWIGREDMRKYILKKGTFWGNDNAADDIVKRFVFTLGKLTNLRAPKKGGVYRFGAYIGYNESNVSMGKQTKATPDGRHDGDYFASAMSAGVGKDVSGITAYLKSVAKIDYTTLIGPLAVNLKLEKNSVEQTDNTEKIAHLFEAYFKMGGLQLQPDYLSKEELILAQKNPEDYRNLRVRVTGFSGLFTRLDQSLQDEIINRTEYTV